MMMRLTGCRRTRSNTFKHWTKLGSKPLRLLSSDDLLKLLCYVFSIDLAKELVLELSNARRVRFEVDSSIKTSPYAYVR